MGNTITPWNVLSGAIKKKVDEAHTRAQQQKDQERETEYKAWEGILTGPNSTPDERNRAMEELKKLVPKDSAPVIEGYHKLVDLIHQRRAQKRAQGGAPGTVPGQPAPGSVAPQRPGTPPQMPQVGQPSLGTVLGNVNDPKRALETATAEAEAVQKAQIEGQIKALVGVGFTLPEARDILRKKMEGAGGRTLRDRLHPVTLEGPNGEKTPGIQDLDTGKVYTPDMKEVENPKLYTPPLTSTQTTGTTKYDPNTGETVSTRKTVKTPEKPAAPAVAKPVPAASAPAHVPRPAVPKDLESPRIKAMAEGWAKDGEVPPVRDRAAVQQYMQAHDLQPGFKPTGQSRSRADAGVAVVPLVTEFKAMLQDPEIRAGLGALPGRVSEAEKYIGNAPPKIQKAYGTLKSIYALSGAMHGWRSLKVADEFEKAYGGLHTNPDSLDASMDALVDTARDVYYAGYGRQMPAVPPGLVPGAGGGPAPGEGGKSKAKTPDDEANDYLNKH